MALDMTYSIILASNLSARLFGKEKRKRFQVQNFLYFL